MNHCFFNGDILPIQEVHISPLDRGFLFGDGVYEVLPVYDGHLFHLDAHIRRLNQSLEAIHVDIPYTLEQWQAHAKALMATTAAKDITLYIQVTRGVSEIRAHHAVGLKPTILMMLFARAPQTMQNLLKGCSAVTQEDTRWHRCHIKSTSLLANVLHIFEAKAENAFEPILIRMGHAVEGASTNLFIVEDNKVITPPLTHDLLGGVTREVVLTLLKTHKIPHEERSITTRELRFAQEIWLTSSTREILPVLHLDGNMIGNGEPGLIWHQVIKYYKEYVQTR